MENMRQEYEKKMQQEYERKYSIKISENMQKECKGNMC